MMMSIALRFIPTLIEETDKIMNAQKARGAQLDNGKMTERIKALVPVLVPLFISAFRRADELAMAMECRCYRGGDGRTRLKVLRCEKQDYIDLAVCIACFAVILASMIGVPEFLRCDRYCSLLMSKENQKPPAISTRWIHESRAARP